MIRYFKTRDSKIVENGYSRIYTFLPDYLLHQEELSPELEEFIWCEIEKEYKIEKLEIPFMGMPYNLLAGLMGGEVPKDSEKVAELYIQKAKKLVDTHPVFFEHLGGEKIYEWNGNEKQGYEWWLYLTEKMPHSTEILKNLLKMFRSKNMLLKGIVVDSDMTDKEVWLRNFVRINKRISKYYEANEELQHFYFAWLLNILLSITSEKSLSAMENKGKAWEDLIGILRRFWSGQHIVDVHKSMSQLPYRYQYIRNIDELKLDILNIIKELSQKPYCYRIRNGNDLDWLFMEFIRFDDIDKEMIIAGKRMVFGIRTFQYENEEVEFLEVCAYSKLMNYFLKIRKEEELLQHTLDSGLFPKSYIGRAIDAALGKGELKMVSLLLSRLS
jgi:hypothetical protein